MELFENIYSLWAVALVLLCAGNGLFFLGYATQPNWLWKQTVSVPVSGSASSKSQDKKATKKNSKKSKASKNKAAKREEEGSKKDAGQRSSTGLSSDSDIPTTSNKNIKQIPLTSQHKQQIQPSQETVSKTSKKSSSKSGPATKAPKQEQPRDVAAYAAETAPVVRSPKQTKDIVIDGHNKATAKTVPADKKNAASAKQQPPTTVPAAEEIATDKKKQRKKKAKKQAAATDAVATTPSVPTKSASSSQAQQASDNDSQEEWNVVSSDGKAKRPKAASSKSGSQQASSSGDASARSVLEKFALSVDSEAFSDSQHPEVASLVDVLDWSLAELKEKEAQYNEKLDSANSSLEKIINARIVGIPDASENNGFAASAAVASVHHHLKRKLMSDVKAQPRTGGPIVDESAQSSKPNQFAHLQQAQQLAYEHQIRTNEIQQEFLKSTSANWGRSVVGGFGTSAPMRHHETADLGTSVGAGSMGAWGEQPSACMPRYNLGQTLQSSFEFVPQRNLPVTDTAKMIGVDCDEGSIAFRRRNSADFAAAADRAAFEKAVDESRTSDSTEEEYSVIDTVVSSEFSRRNNSNGSLIDVVEDSIPPHEFTFDDGHNMQATDDEHLDDIDLIDEFSMASISSLPNKPAADMHFDTTAKAAADVVDDSTINSSLTFHGREHGPSSSSMFPQAAGMSSPSNHLACQKDSKGVAELASDGAFYTVPGTSGLMSASSPIMSCCHPWIPPKLTCGNTDQVKNGFVTYKAHKQFAILEAMRAMQARHRGEDHSTTMVGSMPQATTSSVLQQH